MDNKQKTPAKRRRQTGVSKRQLNSVNRRIDVLIDRLDRYALRIRILENFMINPFFRTRDLDNKGKEKQP